MVRFHLIKDSSFENFLASLMQSALSMVRRFPPPSASSDVFAWLDGTGARLATDTGVALVLEFVVRHVVLLHVLLHVFLAPVDERIHLDEVVDVVPFHHLHILAGDALLLAQSANPDVQAQHGSLQRLQLAHLAAAVAALDAIIK